MSREFGKRYDEKCDTNTNKSSISPTGALFGAIASNFNPSSMTGLFNDNISLGEEQIYNNISSSDAKRPPPFLLEYLMNRITSKGEDHLNNDLNSGKNAQWYASNDGIEKRGNVLDNNNSFLTFKEWIDNMNLNRGDDHLRIHLQKVNSQPVPIGDRTFDGLRRVLTDAGWSEKQCNNVLNEESCEVYIVNHILPLDQFCDPLAGVSEVLDKVYQSRISKLTKKDFKFRTLQCLNVNENAQCDKIATVGTSYCFAIPSRLHQAFINQWSSTTTFKKEEKLQSKLEEGLVFPYSTKFVGTSLVHSDVLSAFSLIKRLCGPEILNLIKVMLERIITIENLMNNIRISGDESTANIELKLKKLKLEMHQLEAALIKWSTTYQKYWKILQTASEYCHDHIDQCAYCNVPGSEELIPRPILDDILGESRTVSWASNLSAPQTSYLGVPPILLGNVRQRVP